MKAKKIMLLAGCIALLAGCQDKNLLPPSNQLVVVRAYMQAGSALREIHLASTLDLGSPDSSGPPIRDATVHVIRNQICYELSHFGSGYYGAPVNPYNDKDCPACGLNLFPGDTLDLEVYHFGKIATASTIIPPKPVNFVMSQNPVVVPGQVTPGMSAFEVSWDMDGDFWFYVEMWNFDNPKQPIDGGELVHNFVLPYVSEPFNDKRFIVPWEQLPYYGRYRIKVVAVNREYVELVLTRNQDSRDLNEPISNVTNGLGIFTAVNSSYIDFLVTD